MSALLVSVIVPTRNSERTLRTCLESIRRQSYEHVELIVVDNGSSDATVQIAHQYADRVVSLGPERSAQRNYGARLAKGEYLLFIDSDMILDSNVASESVMIMQSTSAPAAVIPEISIGEGFWARCRALERSCYAGDDLVEAARLFRRDVFEATGGFDEELNAAEDWDLSLRVAGGRRLRRIPARIIHDEGRVHLSAWLAKKRYYAASFKAYWRKHGNAALSQANLIFRPAFVRHWRILVRRPNLMVGLLCLKTLESAAGILGLFDGTFGRCPRARAR